MLFLLFMLYMPFDVHVAKTPRITQTGTPKKDPVCILGILRVFCPHTCAILGDLLLMHDVCMLYRILY